MVQNRHKVLVVDDEPHIRAIIRTELESENCEVFEADNGVVALEVLEKERCHIVISDLQMPLMGGLALLEEVRKRNFIGPFIVVTAFGDLQTSVEAMRLGAFDFISKPFDHSELIGTMNRAFGACDAFNHAEKEIDDLLNNQLDEAAQKDNASVGEILEVLLTHQNAKKSS